MINWQVHLTMALLVRIINVFACMSLFSPVCPPPFSSSFYPASHHRGGPHASPVLLNSIGKVQYSDIYWPTCGTTLVRYGLAVPEHNTRGAAKHLRQTFPSYLWLFLKLFEASLYFSNFFINRLQTLPYWYVDNLKALRWKKINDINLDINSFIHTFTSMYSFL